MTNNILCDIIIDMGKSTEEKILKNYNHQTKYNSENAAPIGLNSLIKRSSIPLSHKRIADNYIFLKKIYGSLMTYSNITAQERELLAKFDFAPLEYSTEIQIKDEIEFLKKWSSFQDEKMSKSADEILQIRVKELKNIVSNRYVFVSNEIYTGFRVLEQYLESISKY